MTASSGRRLFAVIPAAGRSRRMGMPKLLLRLGEETVISRLIRQLSIDDVRSISILVRAEDKELQTELRQTTADVVIAKSPPVDMKHSVLLLLEAIHREFSPDPEDAWLLIPADHPTVDSQVLHATVSVWKGHPDAIVVPTYDGRRGHPTIFPWKLFNHLDCIPAERGLNWLVETAAANVLEVACPYESVLEDIDTPEQFASIQEKLGKSLKNSSVSSSDTAPTSEGS